MKNYWTQSNDNIFVAAHRGWSAAYPENSMIAFQKAAELGVDQIELDIRVTKDDVLVVFHDETVERVSNGTGKVRRLAQKFMLSTKLAFMKNGSVFQGLGFRYFGTIDGNDIGELVNTLAHLKEIEQEIERLKQNARAFAQLVDAKNTERKVKNHSNLG